MADWKRQTLEAHNDFRREHGACALQWSDECYQAAKKQANACQAKRCMFHGTTEGPSGRHGQNIFWCSAPGSEPNKMVKAWYDEIAQYDFGGDRQKGTGHFTQVVWKGSTHMGMALSDDGRFCVANYFPGGNVIGQFKQNVLPRGTPYVPAKESKSEGRRSSSVSGPRSTETFRVVKGHDPQAAKFGYNRRPSWSGVTGPKSQLPQAPQLGNDMASFFKDLPLDMEIAQRGGYPKSSDIKSTVTKHVNVSEPARRRSSSCSGTRTTTTVTKMVDGRGTVTTTRTVVQTWS